MGAWRDEQLNAFNLTPSSLHTPIKPIFLKTEIQMYQEQKSISIQQHVNNSIVQAVKLYP